KFEYLDSVICFFRAQNETQRLLLARAHLVLFQPAQIKFHLSKVTWHKPAELQINNYQTPQAAMEEQEVQVKVLASHDDPLLASKEGKVAPQLDQKLLQIAQNGGFQILFRIGTLQPKEIEKVRIAKHQIRGQLVFFAELLEFERG